jgi:hypothetical protein
MRSSSLSADRHIEQQPEGQPVVERRLVPRLEMERVKIKYSAELIAHIRHLLFQITVLYMYRVTNAAEFRERSKKRPECIML